MELEMLKEAIVKVLKIDARELTLETRFVEDCNEFGRSF